MQDTPLYHHVSMARCHPDTLRRLHNLHESEIITLYTPFIPHSPSSNLSQDMDPFEPLGRALPRRVRHVPYRLDHGMTEIHTDFLSSSGAIIIVLCVTNNVLRHNRWAFEQQVGFARSITRRTAAITHGFNAKLAPTILLLLVNNEQRGKAYIDSLPDFPAVVEISDYSTAALTSAARVLFAT